MLVWHLIGHGSHTGCNDVLSHPPSFVDSFGYWVRPTYAMCG